MSIAADGYARQFAALLPPGRTWKLLGDSKLQKLLLGIADEFARLDGRVDDLQAEAIPSLAVELLADYERELALPSDGTNAERQARIVARIIARQRYRPVDFQNALAPLLGQAPADVVVMERSAAFAASVNDVREIFRFFIYRDPAAPGTYYIASAQALVDKIKPSHTLGYVIESVSFLCDDPHSLCDRDLLGV